jgi:hypothetical protein
MIDKIILFGFLLNQTILSKSIFYIEIFRLFYSVILFSFPLLRIVKKKGSHVQKLGHLRVFDSQSE